MIQSAIAKGQLRAIRAWLFVAALVVLCTILAVLQYSWIGEISVAEKDRMKAGLQTGLQRLARDFNSDIGSAMNALTPRGSEPDSDEEIESVEDLYSEYYTEWLEATRHPKLFRTLAVAVREPDNTFSLRRLDPQKRRYVQAPWPAEWAAVQQALERRPGGGGGGGGRPPGGFGGGWPTVNGNILLTPRLVRFDPGGPGAGPGPGGPPRRIPDLDWLIAELNLDYFGSTFLPDLLDRHLGKAQYDAKVTLRGDRPDYLFGTPGAEQIKAEADGITGLLDLAPEMFSRFSGRGGPGRGGPGRGSFRRTKGPPPMPSPDPERGRWTLSVWNKAGSLDAIIARARWRNFAISLAVLGLVVATSAALIRFSRQAERLAQLQMDFVAGISHELRTPITVIRMAAFNLKGKIAQNPSQVERYGTLIQQESERLTGIVEQVLRFASIESGKALHQEAPIAVDELIAHSVEACRSVIEHARCEVEQNVTPRLPLVLGDSVALQHALQNLITNAVKYGTETSNWIGISASEVAEEAGAIVEIRVADRGPGIPEEEQPHLFDPFFRGKRAMSDQIHGTGLGLNLVKKIVDAHKGTIRVTSAPGKGTEFVIRIPVAPAEYQDEFAHSIG
jgi:signal transduction histidine kinase